MKEMKITLFDIAMSVLFFLLILIVVSAFWTGPMGCHPVMKTPTPLPTYTPQPTQVPPDPTPTPTPTPRTTILGTNGDDFTLNGEQTFLVGISYYGGLADNNSLDQVKNDIDWFVDNGFNWMRVWANWFYGGRLWERNGDAAGTMKSLAAGNLPAIEADPDYYAGKSPKPVPKNRAAASKSKSVTGGPVQHRVDKLHAIVDYANERGFIIDITGAYCNGAYSACEFEPLQTFADMQAFWSYMASEFKRHRNIYFDLANEHDVPDQRCLTPDEVLSLRTMIKKIDPARVVTCSGNQVQAFLYEQLDFFSPHLGRGWEPWRLTCPFLESNLPIVNGRPIHLQEPFRTGYFNDTYTWNDFCLDLTFAVQCGAAGWCLHTDAGFRLDTGGFRDALDAEEQLFIQRMRTCAETTSTIGR